MILFQTSIFLILLMAKSDGISPESEFKFGMASIPVREKEVLSGQSVSLPCTLEPTDQSNDLPILILLFHNEERNPFASVDFRNLTSDPKPRIFTMTEKFKGRISFSGTRHEKQIRLEYVKPNDEGIYRCRVDFQISPTRINKVKLKVIDPIHKLLIRVKEESSSAFNAGNMIGPYKEGSNIILICKALGGNRIPNITWWNQDKLLLNQEQLASVNILTLGPLTRLDRYKTFTCQATNSNLIPSLAVSVSVDVEVPPSGVRITTDKSYFEPNRGPKLVTISEGEILALHCQVFETDLDTKVVWEKDSNIIERLSETILNGSKDMKKAKESSVITNSTQSIDIVLKPTYLDNGSLIRCKAFNVIYPTQGTEDAIRLNVLFRPRIFLTSRTKELKNISKGEDLYLDCQVTSNPPVSIVKWQKSGIEVNSTAATLISSSSKSLIVREVTFESAGIYQCSAENSLGFEYSETLNIQVKSPPECITPSQAITADLNSTIHLKCDIRSHPSPTTFKWEYATAGKDDNRLLSKSSNVSMVYEVLNKSDFQTLLCWAENIMGKMDQPCSITVIPSGKPEKLHNCRVIQNRSDETSILRSFFKCESGWDGGFKQIYNVEVYNKNQLETPPLFNTTLERPTLEVTNMISSPEVQNYVFKIIAKNSRGKSAPVSLVFPEPVDKTFPSTLVPPSSLTFYLSSIQVAAIILGIVMTLFITIIVVACFLKWRFSRNRRKNSDFYYDTKSDEADCFIEGRSSKCSSSIGDGAFRVANFEPQSAGRLVIGTKRKKNYELANSYARSQANTSECHCTYVKKLEEPRDALKYKSNLNAVEKFHRRKIRNSQEKKNENLQNRSLNSMKSLDSLESHERAPTERTLSLQTVLLNPEYNIENNPGILV